MAEMRVDTANLRMQQAWDQKTDTIDGSERVT